MKLPSTIHLQRLATLLLTCMVLMACSAQPSQASSPTASAVSTIQPIEATASSPAQTEAPTLTPTQAGGELGSQLEMVSINPDGQPLNGNSDAVAVSDNGLYVAFTSNATNLVPEKTTDAYTDVFVYDHASKKIVMVSVSTDGQEGNDNSGQPMISADGRFVVFTSAATNLVPNDDNGKLDVFIHDRDSDGNGTFDEPGGIKTELVSVSLSGGVGNDDSWAPHLHGNGRYIAFFSRASNLVSGNTDQCSIYDLGDTTCTNVYVRDMQTSKTVRTSVSSSGEQENQ
ncbi:MAG: hypothetical protein ABSF99_10490, partial [Anaerolineales bacterium]